MKNGREFKRGGAATRRPNTFVRPAESPQFRSGPAHGAPHGQDDYVALVNPVVNVIPARSQEYPTNIGNGGMRIVTPGQGRTVQQGERRGNFLGKQIRGGRPFPAPPAVDRAYLSCGFWGDDDARRHRRFRSSRSRSSAGRSLPALAETHAFRIARSRASRSLGMRSSPSSSTTRSKTVPSGRVVG